jgi:hypothetical protein
MLGTALRGTPSRRGLRAPGSVRAIRLFVTFVIQSGVGSWMSPTVHPPIPTVRRKIVAPCPLFCYHMGRR